MILLSNRLIDPSLFHTPLFGVTLTIGVYVLSLFLYKRCMLLHPIVVTTGAILLFLFLTGVPYESYQLGGDLIVFILGPATVALAVPLYKHFLLLRQQFFAILIGVIIGAITGIVTAIGIVTLFGGTKQLMISIASKTVTTPIAIEIVQMLGGAPALVAVLTALTGLIGSMIGPSLLKVCGITSDIAIGTAMGTSSHGIGTARLLLESEKQGSVSGFAMGLTGVVMSIFAVFL